MENNQEPRKTIVDLGKMVKTKYPGVYDDMPDAELGKKIKAKYPQYGDFADVAETPSIPPVETPTEPTVPFGSAQPSASPSQSSDGVSLAPSFTMAGQKTPNEKPVAPSGPETSVPVFVPETEGFATKSPLLPSQKPDAEKSVTVTDLQQTYGQVRTDVGLPRTVTTLETDQQKIRDELARQDKEAIMKSTFLSKYADLDEEGVRQKRAQVDQDTRTLNARAQEYDATIARLNYSFDELQKRRTMLEGMAGKDQEIRDSAGNLMDIVRYQDVLNQFNADAKALDREARAIDVQFSILTAMGEKSEMDKELLAQREFDIKAQKGNMPAGLLRAATDITGQALASFASLAVVGDEEFKESQLDQYRKSVTELTGLDNIVTQEYIQKQKESNILVAGTYAAAEMLPALLAASAGGAPAMAATFFASSYDQYGQEMKGEYWDQVDPTAKNVMQLVGATVSAGISSMGLSALAGRLPIVNNIAFNVIKKMAPGMTSGQIRRLVDAETKSYVTNVLSRTAQGLAYEAPGEALDYTTEELGKNIFEWLQQDELGENAQKLFANAETLKDFGKGLLEAGAVGSVAGGVMGASLASVQSTGARERITNEEYKKFRDILSQGVLKSDFESMASGLLAAGKMDKATYDKAMDEISTAEDAMSQIPEDMEIEKTRRAFDLLLEKAKLKKKDPALVGDRIKAIDQELARISTEKKPVTPTTDAVQEPTTAEVGAQPSRTEGPREEGGGGVRPGVEGTEATQAGGAQAEVVLEPTSSINAEERKQRQLDIINQSNPAPNDYSTWIRKIEDIKTAEEAFAASKEDGAMYSDFTEKDMQNALSSGEVTVYSSYPIKEGIFVSPSKINAQEYAGGRGGKIYSKKVKLEDIAWIDEGEGQFAPVKSEKEVVVSTSATKAAPAPALPQEIESLDDNQIVTLTYQSLDEIPDALRSKAKSIKSGGVEITTRKSILGIPVGKETKIKTPTKESYIVVASGAEIKQAAREQLAMTQPAAPAATTEAIAAPKAETMSTMEKLAKAEEKQNSTNKSVATKGRKAKEKMLAEDARLAEVNANFDKAVQELENAGKLKVRCP
jgi:hypothetical protein